MLAECQQKRKIITLLSVRDAVKRDVPKRVIGYRGEKKRKEGKGKKEGQGIEMRGSYWHQLFLLFEKEKEREEEISNALKIIRVTL